MKTLSNSKNSIVGNIVAMFALIGVITFFGIYLSEFNNASDIPLNTTAYGSEIFLWGMFIISASIALVYDMLRIIYKIKQIANDRSEIENN